MDAALAPSLDLSPSGCNDATDLASLLLECKRKWFFKDKEGEMENTYKMPFFFSPLLPRPWHTDKPHQLYESLFSWRDTKPPSKPTTGELDLHHTSRYSSDIFLLLTKMYRSSSSSSGTRVGGPSIKDLDLVWGRELRSGFLLKAHLGEERLGSRFGPC